MERHQLARRFITPETYGVISVLASDFRPNWLIFCLTQEQKLT